MRKEKNVIIVTPDKKLAKQIAGCFLSMGYRVAGECKDGASGLRLARMILPQFIVIDDDLLDQKGAAIGRILGKEQICPVIVYSNKWNYIPDPEQEPGLLLVLAKPLQQDVLQQLVIYMEAAYEKIKELEKEISKLQKDLENRKLVERAKGILMEKRKCSEKTAYQWMRQTSMNKMVSLAVVAKEIIAEQEKNLLGSESFP